MANHSRFRHADPKRVISAPVDSGTVIEVGDFLYYDTDDVKNAASLTYITSGPTAAIDLSYTQMQFASKAAGIALDKSASGDTDNIAVGQAGIYEMPCASATWEIGDLVGVDDDATPLLTDQQVINVTETNGGAYTTAVGAIGRCVERHSSAVTSVKFELMLPSQMVLPPQVINIFKGLHTSAADLVTDWAVPFPFTLLEVRTITTILTAGAGVISIHNGATALDDTVTVADATAVGAIDSAAMVDATGDHIFDAGDTLSVVSDGTPTAGEILVQLIVQPFQTNAL